MDQTPIAVIAGVGEGLGYALGRRFAKAGYNVALAARSADRLARLAGEIVQGGGKAFAAPTDLREEQEVIALFDALESEHGPVEVAVFNAGANFRASIHETPADMFEKIWRLGCFAGFLFGREAARRMAPRGKGTLLFIGATASVRARFADRAKELGPEAMLATDAIAELYYQIHAQPRSAWTFEADLRPWAEKF
jgi:NAD(P)-dependent dehydrogenase (short-subunit alcohol dehydrogenase family)